VPEFKIFEFEFEFFLEKNLAWVWPFRSSIILWFGLGHSLFAKCMLFLNPPVWPGCPYICCWLARVCLNCSYCYNFYYLFARIGCLL
jgi:hypothetical protein